MLPEAGRLEKTAAEPERRASAPLFSVGDLRAVDPFPEPIPPQEDCLVFNGGDMTVEELLKGDTQPVMLFRRNVWDEVRYLVGLTPNTEMAMFLVMKPFRGDAPKYVAYDLFFPMQETGAAGVRIDGPSMGAFYDELSKHELYGKDMHRRLCHLHSHADMATVWSQVDDAQQLTKDDLGYYDTFRYYCVTNVRDEIRCAFVTYHPLRRRFDAIPVIVAGRPEEIPEERKRVLESWVRDRTSPLTANVFADVPKVDPKITEEYRPYVAPKRKTYGFGYREIDAAKLPKTWNWSDDAWWDDILGELPKKERSAFRPLSKEDGPRRAPAAPGNGGFEAAAARMVRFWTDGAESPPALRRASSAFLADVLALATGSRGAFGRAAEALGIELSSLTPIGRIAAYSSAAKMFGGGGRPADFRKTSALARAAVDAVCWLSRNDVMVRRLGGLLGSEGLK